MKLLLVFTVLLSASAQAANYGSALYSQLNRAVNLTSALMGVNFLPQSREIYYEGKTAKGDPCVLFAKVEGGRYQKSGVRVKLFAEKQDTLIQLDISLDDSESVTIEDSFGKFNLSTTFRNRQNAKLDVMSLKVANSNGTQTVTLTENGNALTCTGFKLESKETE